MDDSSYRVSPGWAARSRFTGADGAQPLGPIDLAILINVAGRVSDHMPAEGGDVEDFVAGMREQRDLGDEHGTPFSVHVRAIDTGLRLGQFAKACDRLRHARNRGECCFTSVVMTPDGKGAVFSVAGGVAMLTAHRAFAPRLAFKPGQRIHVPFADRAYVEVRPSAFAGFRSVSSAPVALRLLSWLMAGSAEALPPDHRCEVDDQGRWLIRATHDDVGSTLGITTSRATLGYFRDLFPRIARDILPLGIRFRAVADPVHRSACNWRIRFHRVDRIVQQWTDHEEDDDTAERDEASSMLSRIVRASRSVAAETVEKPIAVETVKPVSARSEVFTLMDDLAVEPVEPEPVEPAETIVAPEPIVRPRPVPRGRMMGMVAIDPEPDVIEPEAEAEQVVIDVPLPEDHGDDDGKDEAIPRQPVPLPPPPVDRSVVPDYRPKWLRRRFNYTRETLPGLWSDRPIGTNAELADALREGVHVWAYGMDARPIRYQGLTLDHGGPLLVQDWSWARDRSYWCTHMLDSPGVEWTTDDGSYVPTADDDPEGDLVESSRTRPRDLKKSSGRPHDGLGFVDEDGNPVHETGKPMDRSRKEKAWDNLVPRITEIA